MLSIGQSVLTFLQTIPTNLMIEAINLMTCMYVYYKPVSYFIKFAQGEGKEYLIARISFLLVLCSDGFVIYFKVLFELFLLLLVFKTTLQLLRLEVRKLPLL